MTARIESTPGVRGGRPRIAGRGITVENIAIWHERLGQSVDQIAVEHDLGLAEVHAALAYYFDHKQEIDRSIEEGEAFVAEMKRQSFSKLAQKLGERRAASD